MTEEDDCGPDGSSKVIKRILTKPFPGVNLDASCEIHDGRYDTLGYSRHKADLEFLGNSIKTNFWNPLTWLAGIIEYVGVAIGGGKAYKKAQVKAAALAEKKAAIKLGK